MGELGRFRRVPLGLVSLMARAVAMGLHDEARLDRKFVEFAKQMNLYLNHFEGALPCHL